MTHALVRAHPETDDRSLYLDSTTNGRSGDLVLWDNGFMMHRCTPFDPRRVTPDEAVI